MHNLILNILLGLFFIGVGSQASASQNSSPVEVGNFFAKQGKYSEALNSLNEAIQINPTGARAYKIRGHVYFAMGDYAQAFTDLDHVVALVPNNANALVDRAIVYSVMGNHGLALADVERALALKPSSSFAQAVRKEILERAK